MNGHDVVRDEAAEIAFSEQRRSPAESKVLLGDLG